MPRPTFESVNAYIAAQPPRGRPVLERVRATLRKALPGAKEGISYQIPVYKLNGVMVLYFAGYAGHYAIYPATPHVVTALKKALKGLLHGRATIRFPIDEPVQARLVTRIAKLRAEEALERALGKRTKKKASKKAKPNGAKKRATRR